MFVTEKVFANTEDNAESRWEGEGGAVVNVNLGSNPLPSA